MRNCTTMTDNDIHVSVDPGCRYIVGKSIKAFKLIYDIYLFWTLRGFLLFWECTGKDLMFQFSE